MNEDFERLLKIVHFPISFPGDTKSDLTRWLVKTEPMDSMIHDSVEPTLDADSDLIMTHEKKFMEEEKVLSNWQYYAAVDIKYEMDVCHVRNYPESLFEGVEDRKVYCLSVLYCKQERDIIMHVTTAVQTPIRIWVNGQIAYISNFNYMFRNSFFVFKAKEGSNTILVERLLTPALDGVLLRYRNFILTARPCDQLLEEAERLDHPFIDSNMIERLRQGYKIVPDKAVYAPGEAIGLVVMREYIESGMEDEVTVNLYNTRQEKVASIKAKSGEKITFDADSTPRGLLKVTVESSVDGKQAAPIFQLNSGTLLEARNSLIEMAKERLENSDPLVAVIDSLHARIDSKEMYLEGTGEVVPENIWSNILEKYYDFSSSMELNQLTPVHGEFPLSMLQRKMIFLKRSNIDNGSIPYILYFPSNYDGKKKLPLVVSMFYGFGYGKYAQDPKFSRDFNFSDMILLNICGRGGLNQDYINEVSMFEIIQDVMDQFSIDRDRIYMNGVCTGALKAFGMASRYPEVISGILSLTGTARLDIRKPDYGYLENLSNIDVFQLTNIDDFVYNFTRLKDTANRFKKIKAWDCHGFWHEEFEDYVLSSPKMITLLTDIKKDKYPKQIHFLTSEPIFHRSYWLNVERITDLSKKALAKVEVESESRVAIDLENIDRIGLLLHKKALDLGREVTIAINQQKHTLELFDYTEVDILIQPDGSLQLISHELNEERFLSRYNRIHFDPKRFGIRELYMDRCRIVKSQFDRSKKSFSLKMFRMLRVPLKERTRYYEYNTLKETGSSPEKLSESNFVYLMDVGNLSEPQQDVIKRLNLRCDTESLLYGESEFTGDYFAMIKSENPYDKTKKALIILANGAEAESALVEFMDSFDVNSLFYSDAVIYSNGKYHSFRGNEQTPVVCG